MSSACTLRMAAAIKTIRRTEIDINSTYGGEVERTVVSSSVAIDTSISSTSGTAIVG